MSLLLATALALTTCLALPPAGDPCMAVMDLVAGRLSPTATLAAIGDAHRDAVPALADALAASPDPGTAGKLLEVLAAVGIWGDEGAIRPWLFSPDPETAALATLAFAEVGGARAVPTLEHMVRSRHSFDATQIAIAVLAERRQTASFLTLAHFAEDESRDPILRAQAVRALPAVDAAKTRRWLQALKLPPQTPAFVRAELDRQLASFGLAPTRLAPASR